VRIPSMTGTRDFYWYANSTLLDHPRALVRREAKKALAWLPAKRS
jgi:hypothetical protein